MLGADVNPMGSVGSGSARVERRARIVARGGIIELRGETGTVLQSLIYEERSSQNTNLACKRLIREALNLGFTVFDVEFQSD